MKAFVYDKKTSEKVREILDVEFVTTDKEDHKICIVDVKGRLYQYNMKEVKTTIYQN